ncbi:MAG: hypothetical protein WB646_14645 [Steroidobacteraceae bacterium]
MRRLILFITVAAAVAYIAHAVCQGRRREKAHEDEAVSTWENEGGAPLSDV